VCPLLYARLVHSAPMSFNFVRLGMDVFLNSTGTMLRLGEIETQPELAHSIRCDFRCVLDARA
jgi:hypothetical protein